MTDSRVERLFDLTISICKCNPLYHFSTQGRVYFPFWVIGWLGKKYGDFSRKNKNIRGESPVGKRGNCPCTSEARDVISEIGCGEKFQFLKIYIPLPQRDEIAFLKPMRKTMFRSCASEKLHNSIIYDPVISRVGCRVEG